MISAVFRADHGLDRHQVKGIALMYIGPKLADQSFELDVVAFFKPVGPLAGRFPKTISNKFTGFYEDDISEENGLVILSR